MRTEDQVEANKAVIRRLYEAINQNRPEDLAAVVDPAFQDHSNGAKGPEGLAAAAANLHGAYADLHIGIVAMVGQADLISMRWVETGRHVAPFFNLKPTGKPFEARGQTMYRLVGGKAVESWLAIDPLTVRAQQSAQQELLASG